MDRCFRSTLVLGLLLLAVQAPVVGGDEWRHWRGPDHDGRAPDTGVFGETFGLERAWKISLGAGYSGIVVSGGRLVTMFSDEQTDWLVALDAETGEEFWRYKIDAAFKGRLGAEDGPRSTPVIDDGVVFALGPSGRLAAVDLSDGHLIWATDLRSRFGSLAASHGFTTSSAIEGDVLVVLAGGSRKRSVAGIDKKTGETLWASLGFRIEYQSPVLMTLAGRRQIVVADRNSIAGLDPENGDVLWSRDRRGIGGGHSPQASHIGGNRFLIKFFESIAVFELEKTTEGYEARLVYSVDEFKKSHLPPIFHNGYLYGFNAKFLTCVNAETGEQVWKSRPPEGRGMVLIDDHLVILANEGFVVVVQATPEGYKEKARVQVLDRDSLTWPSFADGRVYVRNMKQIGAASISGAPTAAAGDSAVPPSTDP